jgi:hypothetical protein
LSITIGATVVRIVDLSRRKKPLGGGQRAQG